MGELYINYEYWFAAFQLIFAMFGMGATLTVKDFQAVFKEPKAVSIGTIVQIIVVPLAALLMIQGFGLAGGVAIGIALIAAIPGGTTSNIFTFMAKGNSALSISVTAVTTLACLVTTPMILAFLITEYLPNNFTMPRAQIVTEIALNLLLPLALGMLVLKLTPKHAEWISKWSIRLSLFGILLIVVGSSAAGRLDLGAFGLVNVALIIGFIFLLAVVGRLVPTLVGLSVKDITAIEMEVIVRNVNLGVLIKASMFPVGVEDGGLGDTVLFTILLYGAVQMLIAVGIIILRRKQNI